MNSWGAAILIIVKKLSQSITARAVRENKAARGLRDEEIRHSSTEYHSDTFGDCSGRVSINRADDDNGLSTNKP